MQMARSCFPMMESEEGGDRDELYGLHAGYSRWGCRSDWWALMATGVVAVVLGLRRTWRE